MIWPDGAPLRDVRLPGATTTFGERWTILRRRWRLILRLSLAVGLALLIAIHVLGHPQGFFAPIAALITILAGAGARTRTVAELVIGVAVGVLVGELLIQGIGRGWWQVGVVVALAVVVGTLGGLRGIALNQAASSSILLAAVIPVAGASNPALSRFLDASVGGLVGFAMTLLIPRNPVRDIDRDVQTLLNRLSDVLATVARALRTLDFTIADGALAAARSTQPQVEAMIATAGNVAEIARLSPLRWRQRGHVELYVATVRDLDNAVRDVRVLARRASTLLRHGEGVPPDMDVAVDALATAIGIFADDLTEQDEFDEARQQLIEAARMATLSLPSALTINSAALVAQVRALAADLLLATGFTRDQIDRRLDFE